ncbi:MAG: hypothetical protein E7Z67_06250 [Thermoplasmata archaeon]|nr:hypothetical protein [Thermoplasmata archaeon]
MRLQLIEDVVLHTRDSLIIFDEVQSYPKARQLIKYLVKDGRYDYIETGSLISLKKNITRITLPSEEESITMYPMDFEEFLWAQGNESTIPFIKNAFDRRSPVGNGVHRNILRKYREYIAVGGMPQIVSAFIDNKDFGSIDREKRLIWTLYENDVEKIPSPTDSKVSTILKRIPNMLSKINKRFSPGMIRMGSGMDEYDSSLEWLEQSRIVNICKNVNDPNLTLPLEMGANKVK